MVIVDVNYDLKTYQVIPSKLWTKPQKKACCLEAL